jgi:hypothetical protein
VLFFCSKRLCISKKDFAEKNEAINSCKSARSLLFMLLFTVFPDNYPITIQVMHSTTLNYDKFNPYYKK